MAKNTSLSPELGNFSHSNCFHCWLFRPNKKKSCFQIGSLVQSFRKLGKLLFSPGANSGAKIQVRNKVTHLKNVGTDSRPLKTKSRTKTSSWDTTIKKAGSALQRQNRLIIVNLITSNKKAKTKNLNAYWGCFRSSLQPLVILKCCQNSLLPSFRVIQPLV